MPREMFPPFSDQEVGELNQIFAYKNNKRLEYNSLIKQAGVCDAASLSRNSELSLRLTDKAGIEKPSDEEL